MAAITWDAQGQHYYETGVDHGVLYLYNETASKWNKAVPWNGLTSVKESSEGGDTTALYADNMKYLDLSAAEDFKFSIEAYTYPDEFMECDGTKMVMNSNVDTGIRLNNQQRSKFRFAYRTRIGNDVNGDKKGYKLHLVYGCTASPSDKEYQTVNDSPDAISFSWEVATVPVGTTSYGSISHLIIDSTKADATKLAALEKVLFGDTSVEAECIDPDAVITALS